MIAAYPTSGLEESNLFTSTPPATVICTVSFGIVFLMLAYVLRLVWILMSSRRWIAVPAQLVKVEIRHRKLEDRSLRGKKLIREIPLAILVEYAYENAGRPLRGRALNLMDVVMWGLSVDRRDIEAVRAMGERTSVWVDPEKPTRSVLLRRVPLNGLAAIALLLAMSLTTGLVTAEMTVDTFGSVTVAAAAAVGVAGILHMIARGVGRLMGRRL